MLRYSHASRGFANSFERGARVAIDRKSRAEAVLARALMSANEARSSTNFVFSNQHPHGAPSFNNFHALVVPFVNPATIIVSTPYSAPDQTACRKILADYSESALTARDRWKLGTVGMADVFRGCPKLQAPHSDWNHRKLCRPIKHPSRECGTAWVRSARESAPAAPLKFIGLQCC